MDLGFVLDIDLDRDVGFERDDEDRDLLEFLSEIDKVRTPATERLKDNSLGMKIRLARAARARNA